MQQSQYNQDNVFQKIIKGEIPAYVLYESDNVMAFLDVFPMSRGHSLVIHKLQHATMLMDLDDNSLQEMILLVKKLSIAINEAIDPDGIKVKQFNGQAAGQTIFHMHFHIIPVWDNKNLHEHFSPSTSSETSQVEFKSLQRQIVKKLSS